MNLGKTLFAQVMEFVPWKTFGRIVERHQGDAGVRTLGCADLFRVMAFAQLTWRESLRDIEACLAANQAKLFHMGLKAPPARSTLSDALNRRDWRIYHALAQRLIARARALYAQEPSVLELDASVYALDATTIDLCLSLFEWAPFRSTKAAIKLHTLLDLRGAIPAFIHISDGKLHDVNVLDILPVEAGSFYVMDRGYVDFQRLYAMHQAGAFFVTRAKRGMDARRVYSAAADRASGVICDQRIVFNGFYAAKHYPEPLRRVRFKDPEAGKTQFDMVCIACHGADLVGAGSPGTVLRESRLALSEASLWSVLHAGSLAPRGMPAFSMLSRAQVNLLQAAIRAAARESLGTRTPGEQGGIPRSRRERRGVSPPPAFSPTGR